MDKIYIVTTGVYSDYSINAVFSTKKLAKEYIKKYGLKKDECRIEEYKIDSVILDFPEPNLFKVYMRENGDVFDISKCLEFSKGTVLYALNKKYEFYYDNMLDEYLLQIYVFAKTKKHAIKIVNEKRVQLIAEHKWKKPERKEGVIRWVLN